VLRLEVGFFFIKVGCSDLPHMLLNPNGIQFFAIQFAFNDPMGKSERPNGFKKIVWVPGMARDQKNRQKVPKKSQIVNLEGKMLKFSNKSAFKAEQWACIHYLTPGSGMGRKSGSGTGIWFFWVKIL
jgi:hypothetical protein